jgi:hypothetical protein
MRKYRILKAVKIIAMVLIFVPLLGFLTMSLWNCLVPAIFGFKAITWIQALGLMLLGRLLFGGFKGGGHHGPGRHAWKARMQARWGNMSDEEKAKWQSRCGKYFNAEEEKK